MTGKNRQNIREAHTWHCERCQSDDEITTSDMSLRVLTIALAALGATAASPRSLPAVLSLRGGGPVSAVATVKSPKETVTCSP